MKWDWVWKNWGVVSSALTLAIVPLLGFLWRNHAKPAIIRRKQRLELLSHAIGVADELIALKAQMAEILALLKPNGGSSLADSLARIEKETHLSQSILWAVQDLSGLAFWRSDILGECTHASAQLADILGVDQSQVLGNGWVTALHVDWRRAVSAEWQDAVTQRRRFSMDYPFRHSDGTKIWVHSEALPIRDRSGGFNGFVGVLKVIPTPKSSKDA